MLTSTAGSLTVICAPYTPRARGELRVLAPKRPAQAVPGTSMLFVVDGNGVPSVGKEVVLPPDTRGSNVEFN